MDGKGGGLDWLPACSNNMMSEASRMWVETEKKSDPILNACLSPLPNVQLYSMHLPEFDKNLTQIVPQHS